ncbi:MAG: glycosyltransferase family 1 protein [Candidatus Omnitrophota bacterium]|jgi:glycosyltransferase involved in cell wall biosynthesis|nr:MAG: glycosyltransferase family 1 protein [Candidatus Omnitrophota bacterium]
MMRILQIIPGTANFYCGSCIRDTALARGLKTFGHDVVIAPMYLPLYSDEQEIDVNHTIFFGGINVYLQQKSNIFHTTPRWFDRWFDAEWLLKASAKKADMTKASELGEMTVSMLKGEEGRQAKELKRLLAWLKEQEPFDVALLSNGMLLGLAGPIKTALNIPIACTLQGEDAFLDALLEPYRTEVWRLLSSQARNVDALIPVSHYYAEVLQKKLHLASHPCFTVQNGITLDGYGELESPPAVPVLGYLARMCKMKGLDTLVEAFIRLKQNPEFQSLTLKIAGSKTNADEPFVRDLENRLRERQLLDQVSFHPNLTRDAKIQFLKSLSVFSVPATYGESFGLYVLEAMAAGVPVVQPRHGGFPEILERTNGGVLFAADQMDSYVAALANVLSDPQAARRMGEQGRKAVYENFSLERMTRDILRVFERIRSSHSAHQTGGE